MKHLPYIIISVVILTAINFSIVAQTETKKVSREQFAELQAKHIAQDLALDDKTSEQFITTYCQYRNEIWQLGPRTSIKSSKTDSETEAAIKSRFEMSEKILGIRQKYYNIYSGFLTQKQIQRMYEIEKNMSRRFKSKANSSRRTMPKRNTAKQTN